MENRFKGHQYNYYNLDRYYKDTYGEKVYKIAVDGGFTCPNRDGTLDFRGCIFCSEAGSGDFAANSQGHMRNRILEAKKLISSKTNAKKFIVYFQSFTNTYGEIMDLRKLYFESIVDDSIIGISIATRPDCLTPQTIVLLLELQQKVDVYVELGLQTIHPNTADFIRRCYPLSTYDKAIKWLKDAGIPVITHLILGLPGESPQMILDSVKYVASTGTQGIKLQLLHVLKGTDLHEHYNKEPFHIFDMNEYIDLVIKSIQLLPPDMVVHRITGDGAKDQLVAPSWSLNKRLVLGSFTKRMKELGAYQSQLYKEISND